MVNNIQVWEPHMNMGNVGEDEIKNVHSGNVLVWDRSNARLPKWFQEVKYIQSNWTQVIRLWSSWNSNYKTEAVLQKTWTVDVFYGIRNNTNYNRYWFRWTDSWTTFWWTTGSYSSITSTWKALDNDIHNITLYNGSLTIDWTSYAVTNTNNISFSRGLVLFWYCSDVDNNYYAFSSMRLYSFKAYNWTTLLYDLVPCYRKSDSVIWLYDLVNGVFYTNSWTGTFTKWPNI